MKLPVVLSPLLPFALVCLAPVYAVAQDASCGLRAGGSQSYCTQITKTFGDQFKDAGYVQEIYAVVSAFGVRPGFFACLEAGGPNAFAVPDTLEPGTRRSVLLGINLVHQELARSGQFNNFSVPAILAHEMSHVVQFENGSQLPTMQRELQADYMAGWYMANRNPTGTRWSESSVQQGMSAFYAHGDYDYNSPGHHGTPAERLGSFLAGFRNSRMSVADIYQASFRYVTQKGTGSLKSGGDAAASGQALVLDDRTIQAIRRLIADRANHFSSVRGTKDDEFGGRTIWNTTLTIPGMKSCSIVKRNGITSFSCGSEDFPDADAANSEYYRLVNFIRDRMQDIGCDMKKSTSGNRRSAECDKGILIRANHRGGREPRHYISFEIDDDI